MSQDLDFPRENETSRHFQKCFPFEITVQKKLEYVTYFKHCI